MDIPIIGGALRFFGIGGPSSQSQSSRKAPSKPQPDPAYFQDSQDLSPRGRIWNQPASTGDSSGVQEMVDPTEKEFLSQLSPKERAIYLFKKKMALEGGYPRPGDPTEQEFLSQLSPKERAIYLYQKKLALESGSSGMDGSGDMGVGGGGMPPYDFSQYDPNDPMVQMMNSLEPGWNKDYEKSDAAQLQVLQGMAKTPIKG